MLLSAIADPAERLQKLHSDSIHVLLKEFLDLTVE